MNLVDYPSIDELVANITNSRYSLVFIIDNRGERHLLGTHDYYLVE